MTENPIIVEQLLDAPPARVWDAITRLDEMKLWYFDNIPAFEPVVGFETSFVVQPGERTFTIQWKVTEVVPRKRISYDWTYKEYEGHGSVTFDLVEKGYATLLILTNRGLETFPRDIPEFKRESCIGGWEFFLQKNLKEYVRQKA